MIEKLYPLAMTEIEINAHVLRVSVPARRTEDGEIDREATTKHLQSIVRSRLVFCIRPERTYFDQDRDRYAISINGATLSCTVEHPPVGGPPRLHSIDLEAQVAFARKIAELPYTWDLVHLGQWELPPVTEWAWGEPRPSAHFHITQNDKLIEVPL